MTIKTFFHQASCLALRAATRAISVDESVCISRSLLHEKLDFSAQPPAQLHIDDIYACKNTLEDALAFNPYRFSASVDLFGPHAAEPRRFGEDRNDYRLPPAIIRSECKHFPTGLQTTAIFMRPQAEYDDSDERSRNEVLSTGIFGMVGFHLDNDRVAVTRLVLPVFNSTRQFVMPGLVRNRQAVIHAALDYASACADQIVNGRTLTAYQNFVDTGLRVNENGFQLQPGGP